MVDKPKPQSTPGFQEDLVLAKSLANGDELALRYFFERYADPLFAFIYHRLESQPGIEDIWQETLISAVNSIGSYRGEGQLFSWLCGLARHKIADYFRQQGRTQAVIVDIPLDDLHSQAAQGPLPEEVVDNQGVRSLVLSALAVLPDDYRTALLLKYADGLTVDDVARELGRSYKATESLLGRARQAFKDSLLDVEEY